MQIEIPSQQWQTMQPLINVAKIRPGARWKCHWCCPYISAYQIRYMYVCLPITSEIARGSVSELKTDTERLGLGNTKQTALSPFFLQSMKRKTPVEGQGNLSNWRKKLIVLGNPMSGQTELPGTLNRNGEPHEIWRVPNWVLKKFN